jgi:hypothetical protein
MVTWNGRDLLEGVVRNGDMGWKGSARGGVRDW